MSEVLKLKKSNCKNCYKCIRHCPVKSIKFTGNQAHILGDDCILCGQCFVVCPQNAKEITDSTEIANVLLCGEAPVIASIAPSFLAYFKGVGFSHLKGALQKLGFFSAEETAIGATLVKKEYERQIREKEQPVIISSCCHSVNLLIRKYYPDLIPYLSPTYSPMITHSMDIKRRYPNAKTIFIGPCVAKKDEAFGSAVDAVLTFDELKTMLEKAGIILEKGMDQISESRARLFPVVGGILKTMDLPDNGYMYMTIDGTENCIEALNDIALGSISNCFIEMSACTGSCIGGPVMEKAKKSPVQNYQSIIAYAGKQDFIVEQMPNGALLRDQSYIGEEKPLPDEEDILAIMRKIGKTKPSDELNCGSCGYNTCREKAIAVYYGKADISMCMPYLMSKNESFTNNILDHSPNGILVVNEDLEVQQISSPAMKIFNVQNEKDVLGEPLVRIFDPSPFMDVLGGRRTVKAERAYYAEFAKYLELTIVSDRTNHSLLGLFRDVTEEEETRHKEEELERQTIEVADKVVDKQMRIVQEIAMLLGETTAETKIALTKLKETISHAAQK